MAKIDAKTESKADNTPGASTESRQPPRLGEVIHVRVAEGLSLINNETGQDFEPGVATLQTVTVTTLRRLADGDLVRI
ncbi:MAG: hypothetical protein A2Z93_06160 [Curvibacter sp. GWA2_64_110]|nr:MAG: hypothetical protein A2Z93_06160 [Curvibacter sp. GWA2_64_110]HCY15617.1 hypothetical protein [Curvibacter sp.]